MSSEFGSLNFRGNLFIRFENVSLATFEESSNILLFIDFFLLDKTFKKMNKQQLVIGTDILLK